MRYTLEGLDCPACAGKIERELKKVKGLENVTISFAAKTMEAPDHLFEQAVAIISEVEPGVKLRKNDDSGNSLLKEREAEKRKLRLIFVAGILFLTGLIFNEELHRTPYSWAEYLVLITAGCFKPKIFFLSSNDF